MKHRAPHDRSVCCLHLSYDKIDKMTHVNQNSLINCRIFGIIEEDYLSADVFCAERSFLWEYI